MTRRYCERVDWEWICWNYSLPEEFIREFLNYVYWEHISTYQELSPKFIDEFADKFNLEENSSFEIIINALKANDSIKNIVIFICMDKKGALGYHASGKLFKVKIKIKDIAAITHQYSKIRATKIKIVEEIEH